MRKVPIKVFDITSAFDMAEVSEQGFDGDEVAIFLDLRDGSIRCSEGEEDVEEMWEDPNLLSIDPGELEKPDLREFALTLDDAVIRDEILKAVGGKGTYRRFKDIVFGSNNIELKHAWQTFEEHGRARQIDEWLKSEGIEPIWDRPLYQERALPDSRPELLRAVLEFVRKVRGTQGVRRIALLGSLARDKAQPKDVDVLVEIEDQACLDLVAGCGRQLAAAAGATGHSRGADVFLCAPGGTYLGRTCPWKDCQPGLRLACKADHCGRRHRLYDDLAQVRLDPEVIASPPAELWPEVVVRTDLPEDTMRELIEPLR